MQFIKNGPDIPADLLEAHEEGNVVFFCGAGISYPAGLPMFKGLVCEIYKDLGTHPSDVECSAMNAYQYDTVLGLLDERIPGGRKSVREALMRSLKPDYNKPKALETHRAILTLGKTRDNETRVVTTNFDRVFEEVIKEYEVKPNRFFTPLLPIPKKRWDGLVYLHGLLPKANSEIELNKLVVSSGDFGLAYLNERWASRFVTELFQKYTICFVGYSINDPILRYMMDALAADKLMGENTKSVFAFADCTSGCEDQSLKEWKAKNVIPILYENANDHMNLHKTLHAWASNFSDGITGKQSIVDRYANLDPTGTTKEDDLVGRLMWALSDKSGLPAKRFADMMPVPSLKWLDPFEKLNFGEKDLVRFGIQSNHNKDNNKSKGSEIKFSLLNRPSPYNLSAWMRPVTFQWNDSNFDNVMKHLARWMARHIDDPELFLWVIEQGGELHSEFKSEISRKLEESKPPMNIVWKLFLSGFVKENRFGDEFSSLPEKFSDNECAAVFNREFKQALSPVVVFRRAYITLEESSQEDNASNSKLSDIFDWEVKLFMDHPRKTIQNLAKHEKWKPLLREFLPDFTSILRDTMDLMNDLGDAGDKMDRSFMYLPSIAPHEQNLRFEDWTILIKLLRCSWQTVAENNKNAAIAEVRRWISIPYPVFKRLAFFAVSENPVFFQMNEVLDWLLSDETYWLWTIYTQRESLQLIRTIAPKLEGDQKEKFFRALVAGPPAAFFRESLSEEELQESMDKDQWLRLAKCRATDAVFTEQADSLLQQLETAYPNWKLTDNDRDEFPAWYSGIEAYRVVTPWERQCEENAECAFDDLLRRAELGKWPHEEWESALQISANMGELSDEMVSRASARIVDMPDKEFSRISHPIALWVNTFIKKTDSIIGCFFEIISKIILVYEDKTWEYGKEKSTCHTIELVLNAVMTWWFAQDFIDSPGIDERVQPVLDHVCNPDLPGLHHGLPILAHYANALLHIDQKWTSSNLLQYFDWRQHPQRALEMWTSFLGSGRWSWRFIDSQKANFLSVPEHWEGMGGFPKKQYVSLLTYMAMDSSETFFKSDFMKVFNSLSTASLAQTAHTLFRSQDSAKDQKKNHFKNRIALFFDTYWPKDIKYKTPEIAEKFANLCAVSGEAFPDAVKLFSDWIQPFENSGFMLGAIKNSDIPDNHPSGVLDLLSRSLNMNRLWSRDELRSILKRIFENNPDLKKNKRYRKFDIYLKQNDL